MIVKINRTIHARVFQCCAVCLLAVLLASCSNPEGDFKKAEQANTERAFSEFIKKHADSSLVAQAKARIQKNAYEEARKAATVASFEGFLQRFQSGELVQHAKRELEEIEFAEAGKLATITSWESFLKQHPQSTNASPARQALSRLEYEGAVKANDIAGYESFLAKYPESTNAGTVRKTLTQLEYASAAKANDIPAYEGFLAKHADSELATDAKRRLNTQLEERDWNQVLLKNSSEAYLSFYRGHTNTDRIKVLTGTVRGELVYGFTASPLSSKLLNSGMQVTLTIDNNSGFTEQVAAEDAARWNLITYSIAGYTADGQAIAMTGQNGEETSYLR